MLIDRAISFSCGNHVISSASNRSAVFGRAQIMPLPPPTLTHVYTQKCQVSVALYIWMADKESVQSLTVHNSFS